MVLARYGARELMMDRRLKLRSKCSDQNRANIRLWELECCFVIVALGGLQYEGGRSKEKGRIATARDSAQSTYTLWKKVAIL